MADNTELDAGSGGDTIATDDIGGIKFPRTKIVLGADGTNDGDVDAANPVPVGVNTVKNGSGTELRILCDADGHIQVDVLSCASHAVTNAGTFAVQVDGDALTALQLIDDIIYADDADWTDGTSKHALIGGLYQSSPQTITDGDTGPIQVTANGYQIVSVNGTVTVGSHAVTNAGTFAVQVDGDALTALSAIQAAVEGTLAVDLGGNNDVTVTGTVSGTGTAGSAASGVMTVQGIASMTALVVDGSGVTQPVSAASLPLPSGAATAANQATLITAAEATQAAVEGTLAVDATGQGDVPITLDGEAVVLGAGSAAIGSVTNAAAATGGCSFFNSIDLDESEEQVKATAATLYSCLVMNMTASVLYLQIFNVAADDVTVGSTSPDVVIPIPTQGDTNGSGFAVPLPACGMEFGTALTVACTTTPTGSGGPAANGCFILIGFE